MFLFSAPKPKEISRLRGIKTKARPRLRESKTKAIPILRVQDQDQDRGNLQSFSRRLETKTFVLRATSLVNTVLNHKPSSAAVESIPVSNNAGLTTVKSCNERRCDHSVSIGKKKSDQFHGVRPRIDLFVSRVPKEYPEQ